MRKRLRVKQRNFKDITIQFSQGSIFAKNRRLHRPNKKVVKNIRFRNSRLSHAPTKTSRGKSDKISCTRPLTDYRKITDV